METLKVRAGEPARVAIGCCNWPGEYPYKPEAQAQLSLSDDGRVLTVEYRVKEEGTAALTREDNGEVWTDSCCELFIQPAGEQGYYNIECNAAGRLLIGHRVPATGEKQHAPAGVLATVRRTPSLGSEPFAEHPAGEWTLRLDIPATALFRSGLDTWEGLRCGLNLYKCGDNLSRPHFLSHAPITGVPHPNFHLPQFFRPAEFHV